VFSPDVAALAATSPSLAPPGQSAAAYELKFLLPEARALEVEEWARGRFALDPHGQAELAGAYRTTTLYCDTPLLHVFRGMPAYRRRKFRLRRYAAEPTVYLERKTKRGDRVRKRRSLVEEPELAQLDQAPGADWAGAWFHKRLHARGLRPACCLSYVRTAYVGTSPDGPMRLTLDRYLRGAPANGWRVAVPEDGEPFLTGSVICELKFHLALPLLFKELVHQFHLAPTAISKYKTCRQGWDGR
jgi:hypothetical protein